MDSVRRAARDLERFWSKVDQNGPVVNDELGPCWTWTAALFSNGYGAFRLDGKQRRAHVVSFEWHIGETDGLQICHSCDVRSCVRPDHLFRGTQKENIQDAVSKNRMANGARNGMHAQGLTILTDDQVREIHTLASAGVPQQEIADRFKVSQALVSHIWLGKKWRHLFPDQPVHQTRRRPSPDTIRSVRQADLDGVSRAENATRHGMSETSVSRIVTHAAYADVE